MPDVKFSNLYPYTDFHELNLDWVIKEVKFWSERVGKSIQKIELTGTVGLVDTYTITYSDGSTSTFDVTNGNGIASVAKTGTVGLVDTYTITFQDGSTTTFEVHNGTASIDPTLTLQNYAADAKATGDLIEEVAESQYRYTFSGQNLNTSESVVPGDPGGKTNMTRNAGYILRSNGTIAGTTSSWIHSDFIELSKINGNCGEFVNHGSVASVAYYSSNDLTSYLGYYSGTGVFSVDTVNNNAPSGSQYVILTTDGSGGRELYAYMKKTYSYNLVHVSSEFQQNRKLMHFSIDDVNSILKDLTDNAANYDTLFDQPFFGVLKNMHDTYGAVFSLYCWYITYTDSSKTTPIFSIANCTADFASDFTAASSWLRLGIHSVDNYTQMSELTAAQAETAYKDMVDQLIRITGSAGCVDSCVRLSSFEGTLAVCEALRDCPCGINGFLTSDYGEALDVNDFANTTGYYLTSGQRAFVGYKGRLFDPNTQLFFFPSNLRLDNMLSGAVPAYLDRFNGKDRYNRSHLMIMYAHEPTWYNSGNINTDYTARFVACCTWAMNNGYFFGFPMDRINMVY